MKLVLSRDLETGSLKLEETDHLVTGFDAVPSAECSETSLTNLSLKLTDSSLSSSVGFWGGKKKPPKSGSGKKSERSSSFAELINMGKYLLFDFLIF